MKIMAKSNLLSLGTVLVTTALVMAVGLVIIDDILSRSEDRLLKLELSNVNQAILRALNRSGTQAGAQAAAGLQQDLRRKEDLKSVQLFIVETPDNRVVYHPDMQAGERISYAFIDLMFQEHNGSTEYEVGGVWHYAVFATVEPIGWLIALSVSETEMFEKKTMFLRAIGGITLFALGFNSLVVSLLGRRILKRIWSALDCVQRIEKGELSARIPVIAVRDEVGDLQDGINAMAAGIEQRTRERRAAEDALREREARIRRLVDANIIGIFFWRLDGGIVEANDAFLAMIGYSREDLEAGNIRWTEMSPPQWRESDERAVAELLATGSVEAREKEYIRKDGSRVPVLLGGAFLEGSRDSGVAFVLDLSERKQAEERLQASRTLLKSIIDNSSAVIYVKDTEGRYLLINRRFAELFHVDQENMAGKTDFDIFPKECAESFRLLDQRVLAAGSPLEAEEVAEHDDGPHTYISIKAPLYDRVCKPFAVCGISTDITGRKRDEEEIRRLNEELQRKIVELQDAQEELVRKEKLAILGQLSGSIGHELRNPLGVMSNAIYFLDMVTTDADETVKEYLGIIRKEIDISLSIIADLLDFARTKPPRKQTVVARALIDESLARLTIPESVELRIDVPQHLPPLSIDPLQIGQVLQNLIANGVQAMPTGGTLAIRAEREGAGMVRLTVADTGEGISPANMKKLFQPLFTTKARGIGLGLVVCRNLTEAGGGRIEVESEPGLGTTFTLVLPIEED